MTARRAVARALAAAWMAATVAAWVAAISVASACSHAPEPAAVQPPRPEPRPSSAEPAGRPSSTPSGTPDRAPGVASPAHDAGGAPDPQRLAALQKALNELDEAAQQCWAAAATERFDIAGEVTLQIDVAPGRSQAQVVHDTARNAKLAACLVELMAVYRWAPPLYGQAIQLPFRFRAPDGQNTIDRALVPWVGQGKLSVAVLLDESNTGNAAASMFELAIAAGGSTGLRTAERPELWYFLGAGQVAWPAGKSHAVAAGDMLYVPRGAAREVSAGPASLHAMIAMVPGGREGAARGGALPTPEARDVGGGRDGRGSPATGPRGAPRLLPAAGARTYGPATIYADAAIIPDATLAASVLSLPAGGRVPEHVHARETEVLYVLAGGGTMTVNGVELPVTATSVVQIPRNTRHAFVATSDVRAVQIYTPAGPEQRFKVHP